MGAAENIKVFCFFSSEKKTFLSSLGRLRMQVEQPHHAPASLGEFARQYAMIVLSILTALALEHLAVSVQNRLAAAESRVRIESELARNLHDLQDAEAINKRSIADAKVLIRALIDQLKSGKPADDKLQGLLKPDLVDFNIAMPPWQRSAWDGALADQSAGHLPATDLQRYAEIYAQAADSQSAAQIFVGGEWLTRAADVVLDYRVGTLDVHGLARTVARFLLATQQIEANIEELSAKISKK
jgi:hypothetical protein